MTDSTITERTAVVVLLVLVLAVGYRALRQEADPGAARAPAVSLATVAAGAAHPSSLYGRVTTYGGVIYEGRLRWGGDEEAFWGNYFNGVKDENPWVAQVPPARRPGERPSIELFGFEISRSEHQADLVRPFMARFGDIARIEAHGEGVRAALERGVAYDPDVRVTLKSGTVFDLDRLEASDFDDGVRVWDARHGVVDLGPRQIRAIEFLPAPRPGGPGSGTASGQLHGTVHTRAGDFTGFIQWNREETVGRDELVGDTADGALGLRFDTIRSIARHTPGSSLVTLLDGRQIVLSDTRHVGHGNRGIYVDDPRYGRVLVSWDAFERVDFSPGGSGPVYSDFPKGRPLTGSVTTRDGRRLAGRLVYDLDESEVTETLDAPSQGVDYTIPFGLVASIVLADDKARAAGRARVTLQSGEALLLERTGDLGAGNAGLLIFADGHARPAYVSWADVAQVDFDRPAAMYPRR